jgi:hypothetical protein
MHILRLAVLASICLTSGAAVAKPLPTLNSTCPTGIEEQTEPGLSLATGQIDGGSTFHCVKYRRLAGVGLPQWHRDWPFKIGD